MFVESGGVGKVSVPVRSARKPGALGDVKSLTTDLIEAEIGELAAHIAAATCRWLELVAEFDRRDGHEADGFFSCGAWVAWRCSLDPRSAREHVRVARRLSELPLVRGRFRRGELSYSKVRAITRVACDGTEAELVEMARHATAAQLERVVRGYRMAITREEAQKAHEERYLSHRWDEDGCLVFQGRLPPEEGALFLKALEAAREGGSATSQGGSAEPRRLSSTDALVGMAEASLAGSSDIRPAGERHQVVVHVDASALAQAKEGRCELDDGPRVCADTARRLACDGSLVGMVEGSDGTLDVGRRTRAIPPSIRRALEAKEPCCQFPGCGNRKWVDAHHIVHWANGGKTKLDNLARLCSHHHRLVHEGGFSVARRGDGELVVRRPDGRPVPVLPSPSPGSAQGVRVDIGDLMPLSRGERIDYGLAVEGLAVRAGP